MSEAPPIETTESTVNPDTTSTNVAISDGAVKRLREMTAASGAALIVDEVFGDFPCVPLSDDIAAARLTRTTRCISWRDPGRHLSRRANLPA